MIEIKLSKLSVCIEALKQFSGYNIPALASFKSSEILKQLNEKIENLEKVRLKKAQEYGSEVEIENGQKGFQVSPENMEKFTKEMEELTEEVIKIDKDKIKITEKFPDIKPAILTDLHWMFEM